MRKSLNLLVAAALLTALGACNRAAPDGERQPGRGSPEDERQLDNAVGDLRDASNDMRNDAATVPGAVPSTTNETQTKR